MGLASRFVIMILVPVTILIGFIVTFSLMSGKEKPFDLFESVKILTNNYLIIGFIILIGIVFFGFLLSLRQKLIGNT